MGPTDAKPATEFATALETSLEHLQGVVVKALALAEVEKPGPTAIRRRLELDKSLAWKLGRIASAKRGLLAIEFVPGRLGALKIQKAFADSGLDEEVCEQLQHAFDAVDKEIVLHAGDRSTARAMARAAMPKQRQTLDESLRREHFRTSGEIWGAQARVQIKTDFFAPGRRSGQIDLVGFEGLVDLLRLRPDVSWCVASRRVTKSAAPRSVLFQALQPELRRAKGPPLFTKYCNGALSEISSVKDSSGYTNYELAPDRVGRTGAVSCLIATFCKNVIELDAPPQENNLLSVVDLRTPVELVVFDLYIHRSLLAKGTPKVELLSQLKKGASFPMQGTKQVLPVELRAEWIPTGPGEQEIKELPDHADAVGDVFELAGAALVEGNWKREDFVGLRVKLAYPPIPSICVLRLPLASPAHQKGGSA